ncbi:hypothetical protein HMPREF2987_07490 [Streptococcus sp. HMSC067H01]|uniref:GNAT family N-acetyltransferase n=1 Tax=Streptococcus sp. HMSC067H01 TaxID=1739491 RepID=UPI0008B4F175|nr:GNAT family N-acetyltransferase [Streptococcus sp. HMSC067H01]OFP42208.1 hypothetical protein HMPREF2987_07490 [Streptococcus sp. HMSC067H01]
MKQIIQIDSSLRLVPYFLADHRDVALTWYQDVDLVELVDGVRIPYNVEKLNDMYSYLEKYGDLFWIEFREKGEWLPIGDVTLSQENLPIVIGKTYQHQGIGRKVLKTLIDLARKKGWKQLKVQEIYDFNYASRRCFESLGFVESGSTEKGTSLLLKLGSY